MAYLLNYRDCNKDFSFLGPDTAAAGVDPRRPSVRVVAIPAHDGGVAVARQRDGLALDGTANGAGADQLRSLLPVIGTSRWAHEKTALILLLADRNDGPCLTKRYIGAAGCS
jgi:hypothetical protein